MALWAGVLLGQRRRLPLTRPPITTGVAASVPRVNAAAADVAGAARAAAAAGRGGAAAMGVGGGQRFGRGARLGRGH